MAPGDSGSDGPPRIALFGATGFTGRLTAQALVDRGVRPVLAGRFADRLSALAAELGGGPAGDLGALETAVADVSRPKTVRELVGSGDVLVSTVGPFARYGAPAVTAAIDAGAHYLDSTAGRSALGGTCRHRLLRRRSARRQRHVERNSGHR